MAEIAETIEIAVSPEKVFIYASNPANFPEWQDGVLGASLSEAGPLRVGSRATVIRRVGPRKAKTTELLTEFNPPVAWEVRGTGGVPISAIARGSVVPLEDERRSRVTIVLEFEGHGLGRVLLRAIRRRARDQLPLHLSKLKQILEASNPANAYDVSGD